MGPTEREPDEGVGLVDTTDESPDAGTVSAEDEIAPPGAWGRIRSWGEGLRPAWRGLIAFLSYQLLAFLIWVLPVLPRFSTQHIGGGVQDSRYFRWALGWTPWALLHGVDPLHTRYVFAPDGAPLVWSTFVPGPAILTWPVTAVFGSMASLNLIMAVAPALAAWATYLLCNRITGRFWPSVIAGYLFGFSAYIAGMQVGFINLVMIFPVPLLGYLAVRRMEGSLGPIAFVAAAAGCLVLLFSSSIELFASAALFGAVAYVIALILGRAVRRQLLMTGVLMLIAGALTAIVVSPYLAALVTSRPTSPVVKPGNTPAADLWTFVAVPRWSAINDDDLVAFGETHMRDPVRDGTAYLGIGAIALLIGYAITEWRRRETWGLLAFVALGIVLSVGPVLYIGGVARGDGPARILWELPYIHSAIPVRFAAYTSLGVAVIASLWLSRATGRFGWIRWAIVLIAAVMVLPRSIGARPPARYPAFFSATGAVHQVIQPNEIVYGITYQRGDELVWQQFSDYRFRLAQGYLGHLPPELRTGPMAAGLSVLKTEAPPIFDEFNRWLSERGVTAVIVDDRAADLYRPYLEEAGWTVAYGGEGVTVWRSSSD
jgi:hypothetical protein